MSKRLKHAFSLVELVVVTALLGVIMTAVVVMMRPTQKHYNNITNRAQEENICIQASDVIDGELRYATAIKVVYTNKDGFTPDTKEVWDEVEAQDYPNYFHLSNNEREMIGMFKARGYAEKGRTQARKTISSVVERKLFADFDFQFSVAGVNTASGQQSLTIRMDATPMIAQANGMERDEDRTHSFEETFKLINLRNKSSIGGNVLGMNLPIYTIEDDILDESAEEYGEIWIFYAVPSDVATLGSTIPGGSTWDMSSLSDEGAFDPKVPNLYVNGEDEADFAKLVFLNAPSYTGNFKFQIFNSAGSQVQIGTDFRNGDQEHLVYGGTTVKLFFSDPGGFVRCIANDTPGGPTVIEDIPLSRFATYPIIYVYGLDVRYEDPEAEPEDAKIITVHYIYSIGESYGGVNFTGASSGHIVKVDGNNPGFVSCTSDRDITVTLFDEQSSVKMHPGPSGTAGVDQITLDKDSASEYWIYDGRIYTDPSEIPARVAPILFHYLTDPRDTENGFGLGASPADSAQADGRLLGTTPSNFVRAGDFDVTVNLKEGTSIGLYTVAGINFDNVSWDVSTREFWIYKNRLYPYKPETENIEILVHYIKSKKSEGIKVFDTDSIPQSSMLNGSYLSDRNAGNVWRDDPAAREFNYTSDFTIRLMDIAANVTIADLLEYGGIKTITTITAYTDPEIWIYDGEAYTSFDDVPNGGEEPPEVPGTVTVNWGQVTNSWNGDCGQITVDFSVSGGNVDSAIIAVRMTNPIGSNNGFAINNKEPYYINASLDRIEGDTIYVRVSDLRDGDSCKLYLQFNDCPEFTIAEAFLG